MVLDVVILEDQESYQFLMERKIDSDLKSLVFLEYCSTLRDYVDCDKNVDLWVLDNKVQEKEGDFFKPYFIENATYVLNNRSNPNIVYSGSVIDHEGIKFCKENDIYVMSHKIDDISNVITMAIKGNIE